MFFHLRIHIAHLSSPIGATSSVEWSVEKRISINSFRSITPESSFSPPSIPIATYATGSNSDLLLDCGFSAAGQLRDRVGGSEARAWIRCSWRDRERRRRHWQRHYGRRSERRPATRIRGRPAALLQSDHRVSTAVQIRTTPIRGTAQTTCR